MKYASRIQEKKLTFGGTLLVAPFPAHGEVSIVGSLKGGSHLAQAFAARTKRFVCREWGDQLSDMHAAMLLEGTKKKSKREIQTLLDSIGATLVFGADKDRLTFSARVRAVHAEKLLALICESLGTPTFPQEELAHLKQRMLAEVSLEAQDTNAQASINLSRLLFETGHPNRFEETSQRRIAVELMTRTKLLDYHARAVDARSLVLAISGDMTLARAQGIVRKHFSKLPRNDIEVSSFAPSRPSHAKKMKVRIEDKASVDYLLGIPVGITNRDKDYPALVLGLQILGDRGGFNGRLMHIVREQKGLTYGVYAYTGGFTYGTDGYAAIWATFAPQLLKKGKLAIMREVKRIVAQGASSIEVKKHREMFEARTRVRCSNSMSLAHAAHDVAAEGFKPSYLDEFPKKILKLTAREVNKALKKYLILEKLSESAAGHV